MRVLRDILSVALAVTALAGSASAAWLPDGVPVCTYPPCEVAFPRPAPDGAGGVFVVWEDYRPSPGSDIRLQRLTVDGDRAPGWPEHGLQVCSAPLGHGGQQVVADGQGGCFVTWMDARNPATRFDMYAQHVRGDGTLAPGWPVNGLPVALNPVNDQAVAPPVLDGSGGLFVPWDGQNNVWIQHVDASGAPVPGWPSEGLPGSTLPSLFGSCVPDGSGGVILVWTDYRRGCVTPECYDIYGTRYTADGRLVSGWAENGNLLAPGEWLAIPVADSAGKFYVVSSTPSPDVRDASYSVRRLTADGTPAPGWTARGVVVGVAGGSGLRAGPDGVGGVFLAWNSSMGVRAVRVLPTGDVAPGWPAEGLIVSDPSLGQDNVYGIAPDGSGGGYFAFRYDHPSYVQHISAAGTVAPGWPPYGYRVASTITQFDPQLVPSSGGGAIALWEERSGIGSRNGVFAQRFESTGPTPTAVRVSLASSEATQERVVLVWHGPGAGNLLASVERRGEQSAWQPLGPASAAGLDRLRFEDRSIVPGSRYAYRLAVSGGGAKDHSSETWVEVPGGYRVALAGFQPNPASGGPTVAFALADASPATLELLDVHGRRVEAREVGSLGAGSHTLRLEGMALGPGMYWVRLVQAGNVRGVVRGLIMR